LFATGIRKGSSFLPTKQGVAAHGELGEKMKKFPVRKGRLEESFWGVDLRKKASGEKFLSRTNGSLESSFGGG